MRGHYGNPVPMTVGFTIGKLAPRSAGDVYARRLSPLRRDFADCVERRNEERHTRASVTLLDALEENEAKLVTSLPPPFPAHAF